MQDMATINTRTVTTKTTSQLLFACLSLSEFAFLRLLIVVLLQKSCASVLGELRLVRNNCSSKLKLISQHSKANSKK